MENHSQIEELKKIADSKRVPNAIMLYGSNDEKLKAALDFSKVILSLNLVNKIFIKPEIGPTRSSLEEVVMILKQHKELNLGVFSL